MKNANGLLTLQINISLSVNLLRIENQFDSHCHILTHSVIMSQPCKSLCSNSGTFHNIFLGIKKQPVQYKVTRYPLSACFPSNFKSNTTILGISEPQHNDNTATMSVLFGSLS